MPLPVSITLHEAVEHRIRELSRENEFSWDRLARASSVPKSTIADYIRGASKDMKLQTLAAVSNGFGMTLREFFDSDEFDIIDVEALLDASAHP